MHDLTEFRAVYLEELDEQLQSIEEEVLRLEQQGESDSGIQRLFRAAHTLKGSSAAMGYERMKELTHEMEHLLDQVRNHELTVTKRLTDLFFQCLDGMKQLERGIRDTNEEAYDISGLVRALRHFQKSTSQEDADCSRIIAQLNHEEWSLLEKSIEAGQALVWIHVVLSARCEMKQVRARVVDARLREKEEVIWTDLTAEDAEGIQDQRSYSWIVATNHDFDVLESHMRSNMDIDQVVVEACERSRLRLQVEASSIQVEQEEAVLQETVGEAAATFSGRGKSQTIRVHVERLEQLMNLVGELVIDQTGLQQVEKMFRSRSNPDESIGALSQLTDHLTRTISELQESVMKVRMLPMEQLFNRFPRMIRDLALSLHKELELVIEGKETELDRTLIEEIGDPLIHLIRNAIDHGIEPPHVRLQAGKPGKGTLKISAAHEDNQVLIVVEDDGAGIDPDRIRSSAVSKGIITAEEAAALTEQEAIHLIFRAGFSTAAKVSDVSGRGVGMDIVRTEIERLNGLIDIDTRQGEGTRFKIRIPLTLAIITGLVVQAGKRPFILPMNNVAEIVRVKPDAIQTIKGQPVIIIRDQVTPVTWLQDLYGYKRDSELTRRRYIPIVIVGRAERRLAVAVDELIGNQDIVIKSLGSFVGRVEGISGATIMGNGKVALILDAGGMMKLAGGRSN